jgi:hypothetical protein
MKINYFISIILSISLIPVVSVSSQTGSATRDKFTLLTMPYNKRPLNLYRGQFQINAGYKFAIKARSYDLNGDLIILKDKGAASVLHYYFASIKYGITDFLEIDAEANYFRRGIRSESATYVSGATQISVNRLDEERGMGDILLATTIRLPMEYKWFDFGIKGGMYIPSAKFEPRKPTHAITDIITANIYTINYHFNNTNGFGVPVYLISAAAKFSFEKISLQTDFTLKNPLKESRNIRWDQAMANKVFTYSENTYKYLLSKSTQLNVSLHYQAAGCFDINLNTSYSNSSGGWTEYWGRKYKNPEQNLLTIEPGFEIQISPSLTIYQIAGFTLSGKNTDAPFYLVTTLSFNMFPFLR